MCNLNGGGGGDLQRVEEVHADRQQVAVKKLIGC